MNDKIDTIVAGVNRKDEKMWGDFYDRFYAALCVYVSKILPIPDAVEDLVQESLLTLPVLVELVHVDECETVER